MSKTYPNLKKLFLFITICLFNVSFTFGQTVISGMISDAKTKEPLVGISVQIKGKVIGTITDVKGKFSFTTSTPLPIQLVISSVGYKTQEYAVNSENASINISLEDQDVMGQEVVVSASRVEESVMKAAVTVEKLDLRAIRETTAPSFYDAIGNMKGVDLTTQGLLFKSVNMRGFGSTGNVRTVQMIDGMDNQAPGLNFSVDNIVGMPELDVESVELLPGAASALYGPNALNGVILMNSKSPFLYQGLSASVKSGAMVADNRDVKTTPFYDMSLRYAKAFNNKWAFKVNASYLGAQDWQATDYTNLNLGGLQDGTRGLGVKTDYDGQNIYGDEVQTTLGAVANGLLAPTSPLSAAQKAGVQGALNAGLIPASTIVSRTGYIERDLMDYNTKSLKLNGALHYRLNEKTELIGQVNYGYGTTVYSGTGRYGLRNFNITQAKLELKADNYVLRAYTTQERSGKSYLSGLAAINVLNEANPHATWFGEYLNAFLGARTAGQGVDQAHVSARSFADQKNFKPGTAAFNNSLEKYRDLSIANGGSNFVDKTNMYHLEGFYNFKNEIKFAEILVGGNLRQYQLRSNGTLFADLKEGRNGTIPISEFGGFVQAGKSLFKDHLKLTGSVRYDKNQNFEGQFTPRVSAVTSFGKQNIRLSYQTGFRIPTTQNQFIDLTTPQGTLIGGLPEFTSRYNLTAGIPRHILTDFQQKGAASKYLTPAALASVQSKVTAFVTANLPAIQSGVIAAVQAGVTTQVTAAIQAAVAAGAIPAAAAPAAIAAQVTATMQSAPVQATIASNIKAQAEKLGADVTPAFALDALPKYTETALQPERIQSWEIGYKGLVGEKLFIDAYFYQSTYLNFIGGTIVVVPTASANPALPLVSGIGQGLFKGYSLPTNTTEKITSRGWAIGLDYSLGKGYSIGTNIANNELVNFVPSPQQQYAGYNTPQYRYNLSFGKSIGSGDKFGFRATFKHQNAFTWEAGFVQPTSNNVDLFTNTTVPAFNTLDAQVSIKVPSIKSIVKVGGTNIGGNPFIQAYGSASVGSMYYVAVAFDELFNR
jgi:outer membrane receptor protein involved in Fe transport